MKPGATPKPKSDGSPSKPKAKAVWKTDKPAEGAPRRAHDDKKPRKDGPKGKGKPKGTATKPFKGRGDAPAGEKTYQRAADPSKRFTPPNKIGKQGGKPPGKRPKGSQGGNATPRRK